ncbi:MAG: class I SAM-dependent methyltransferase [Actinobacteria bacterium]|nr:class I SAM-dependent methyltransferase [Actinomycetota bacterium]
MTSAPTPPDPVQVLHATLPTDADQYQALAEWVARTAPPAARILDIGSGDGGDKYSGRIRELAGFLAGVDPSPAATRHPNLDQFLRCSVEEYAAGLPAAERFDVALAVYVAEHVRDPLAFLTAARGVLKPAGALFIVTPNRWHYFGAAASTAAVLGIDDAVFRLLRRARPGHGHHPRHYRLAYRMNSPRSLRGYAERAGFTRLEMAHLDNPRLFQYCFPGPAAALPAQYSRLVYRLGLRNLFGTLLCRLTVPPDGAA